MKTNELYKGYCDEYPLMNASAACRSCGLQGTKVELTTKVK